MSRETENTLLLLVGISITMITVTGAFTRYVKPGLLPWLAASAALLIVLALAAIIGDVRRGGRADTAITATDTPTAPAWCGCCLFRSWS